MQLDASISNAQGKGTLEHLAAIMRGVTLKISDAIWLHIECTT
jgi:hypothetical protein